jgi:predicted small secreted protein
MRQARKIILWCLLTAIGASVLGCHTIGGVGRDIQSAGEAIQSLTR